MRRLFLIEVALMGVLLSGCGKSAVLVDPIPHGPPLASPMSWTGSTIPTFSPSMSGDFYRYAPSIVETEPGVRHIYMCGNSVSASVRDHVVHRLATEDASGAWSVGPELVVFGPQDEGASTATTPDNRCGTFDCYHTCDPQLLAGSFGYNGSSYEYALFYTANDFNGSSHNAVGVAFSNSPLGPFVRMPVPLIPYGCGDTSPWSSGMLQPSAVSIDGAGRLHLFTRNDCAGASPPYVSPARYDVDLSNFSDDLPPLVTGPTYITTAGLIGYGGGSDDSIINGDFAYDAGRDRYYVVRHQHPLPLPVAGMMGNLLPYSVQVASITADSLLNGAAGSWQPLGNIAPGDDGGNSWVTGFARNHNAGLVRDPQGNVVEPDAIEVGFTACDIDRALYGRTIHTVRGLLPTSWR